MAVAAHPLVDDDGAGGLALDSAQLASLAVRRPVAGRAAATAEAPAETEAQPFFGPRAWAVVSSGLALAFDVDARAGVLDVGPAGFAIFMPAAAAILRSSFSSRFRSFSFLLLSSSSVFCFCR